MSDVSLEARRLAREVQDILKPGPGASDEAWKLYADVMERVHDLVLLVPIADQNC